MAGNSSFETMAIGFNKATIAISACDPGAWNENPDGR
jgi:hypothetical protein